MTWRKIVDWVRDNAPEVFDDFKPGVGIAKLQTVNSLEFDLPDELIESYLISNGEWGRHYYGVILGLRQNSIEESLNQVKFFNESVTAEPDMYDEIYGSSTPTQKIVTAYMDPLRFPIAHDNGGSYLGLDYNPDGKGIVGQVINFGRHKPEKYVLADNIAQFYDRLFLLLSNKDVTIKAYGDSGYVWHYPSGDIMEGQFKFFYDKFNN